MQPKDYITNLISSGKTEAWIAHEVNRRAAAKVVTQPTINRIKLGRTDNPSWRVVEQLRLIHAEITQISPETAISAANATSCPTAGEPASEAKGVA